MSSAGSTTTTFVSLTVVSCSPANTPPACPGKRGPFSRLSMRSSDSTSVWLPAEDSAAILRTITFWGHYELYPQRTADADVRRRSRERRRRFSNRPSHRSTSFPAARWRDDLQDSLPRLSHARRQGRHWRRRVSLARQEQQTQGGSLSDLRHRARPASHAFLRRIVRQRADRERGQLHPFPFWQYLYRHGHGY